MGNAIGLYIHIPFCSSKCHYCAFSVVTDRSREKEYTEALIQELTERLQTLQKDDYIDTVYIGGGTPSLLSQPLRKQILEKVFTLCPQELIREVTMECNPEQVSPTFLEMVSDEGITRISMGVQTLQKNVLKTFNRQHTPEQAYTAMHNLERSGINWNVDIILGLPGTTQESTLIDVEEILRFHPKHLSAYFLSIEPGTVLSSMSLKTLEDESLAKLYQLVAERLEQEGFEHQEISNWARPGFACKHNLHYWHAEEYIGVGLGASTLYRRATFTNTKNLNLYLQRKFLLEPPDILDEEDMLHLLLTTRTRSREGLSWENIKQYCTQDTLQMLKNRTRQLSKQGLCSNVDEGIHLLPCAYPVHDGIVRFLTAS